MFVEYKTMTPNRHEDLIKIIYFQCLLREGIAAHVLLYTGEMFTVQKTLSHAVLKDTCFFFSQVSSAHALYCT